jgi:hypothetical protein
MAAGLLAGLQERVATKCSRTNRTQKQPGVVKGDDWLAAGLLAGLLISLVINYVITMVD